MNDTEASTHSLIGITEGSRSLHTDLVDHD